MVDQNALRDLLLSTLADARVRNPSYSLRAFAKKLKVNPSALSEILNGKRKVSTKLVGRLLTRLEVDPLKADSIVKKVGNASDKNQANEMAYRIVEADQFNAIASWHHFAILSLVEVQDFRSEPEWIAARLGIKKSEAELAVERLVRLGMLNRDSRSNLTPSGQQYSTREGIRSTAIRASHGKNLELARNALEIDDTSSVDFSSLTMAIDPAKLPKAKKMLLNFGVKLAKVLEADPKSEVYMFTTYLFPVSKPISGDKENLS